MTEAVMRDADTFELQRASAPTELHKYVTMTNYDQSLKLGRSSRE